MARRKRLNPRRRHKCGKPVLEPRAPAVTPELLDQRRRITPGLEDSKLMDQRAGIALEQLLTLGFVDAGQRDAGIQYGALVRRWRRLHGVPNDHRQRAATTGDGEVDAEQAERATLQLDAANARLAGCRMPHLVRSIIESVCVDENIGRLAGRGGLEDRLRGALGDGLSALAAHFRIEAKRHAA